MYTDNERSHYTDENWFAHRVTYIIDAETYLLYEFWFHEVDGWQYNREVCITQPYKPVKDWVE